MAEVGSVGMVECGGGGRGGGAEATAERLRAPAPGAGPRGEVHGRADGCARGHYGRDAASSTRRAWLHEESHVRPCAARVLSNAPIVKRYNIVAPFRLRAPHGGTAGGGRLGTPPRPR